MGLDFSHGDVRFSYSGFHRFRELVASDIGINLNSMIGFGGSTSYDQYNKDPITKLLNHSDCDGQINVEDCLPVATRLREIVSKWPDDEYDKKRGLALADALEDASKNHEALVFR